jgi:hypothetical protein
MSRKAKVKSRPAVKLKGSLHSKKSIQRRPAKAASTRVKSVAKKIVRIMGHGQFAVDAKTLKKLSDIDNSIVELVSSERSDDFEFRKKLAELNDTVRKNSKPVDSREIIKSDIILPSADLSIDEAKKLFRGEGVIPAI